MKLGLCILCDHSSLQYQLYTCMEKKAFDPQHLHAREITLYNKRDNFITYLNVSMKQAPLTMHAHMLTCVNCSQKEHHLSAGPCSNLWQLF